MAHWLKVLDVLSEDWSGVHTSGAVTNAYNSSSRDRMSSGWTCMCACAHTDDLVWSPSCPSYTHTHTDRLVWSPTCPDYKSSDQGQVSEWTPQLESLWVVGRLEDVSVNISLYYWWYLVLLGSVLKTLRLAWNLPTAVFVSCSFLLCLTLLWIQC